ncbi:subtilisin [Purpureocillium lavendulum]|uniref:Subtilisin n=1 Tax=Purpureocillium lavendulum TaxID=1247861 RepID=A0AB34FS85_9HYPO|nr:subtilisin [Purpureocillium lavendulum]
MRIAALLAAALWSFALAERVPGAYIFEFIDGFDSLEFLRTFEKQCSLRMHMQYKLFHGASVQLDDLKNADEMAYKMASSAGVKNMWPMQTYSAPRDRVDWVGTPGMEQAARTGLNARGALGNASDTYSPHVMMQVDKLRAKGITGKGVKVAVVDTGATLETRRGVHGEKRDHDEKGTGTDERAHKVDYSHPALGGCFGEGCLVARGADFVGDAYNGDNAPTPDDDPMDCKGHGTHVAGIIAAQATGNLFGFTGAAPDVSLGAYRVFGCDGATGDDVLMSALYRAYDDGNDIITMSLGSPSGWSERPWAVAVSRIVARGVACTMSAGNEGDRGLFYTGGAADGLGVASIASYENTITPTLFYNLTYTVDGGEDHMVGYTPGAPKDWANVTMPLWASSYDTSIANDACSPLPDGTPDLSDKVVLIRRGECTYAIKVTNAMAKGAKRFLFYNNVPGTVSVEVTEVEGVKAVGMVTPEAGADWIKQLKDGKKVVVSLTDPTKSTPYLVNYPNPEAGGSLSDYTSWGPTWDMDVKPQFGAAGGHILSTYPVKKGSYAVLSGTSMSCPLAAAIYALVGQVRGRVDPEEMENLLSANADPQLFNNGSMFSPYLAPVAQQGGGIIRAYDAAYATTLVEPSSLAFNDTDSFIKSLNFTIINSDGDRDISYSISHVPAITMYTLEKDTIYAQAFPNDVVEAPASLKFSTSKVTLRPGRSASISVSPTPPTGVDVRRLALWSGYVAINGSDGSSLSIPYQGIAGSLRRATVLDHANGTWVARATEKDNDEPPAVDKGTAFTLPKQGEQSDNSTLPMLVANLALGSRYVSVAAVPVDDKGKSGSPVPIADSPTLWETRDKVKFIWDGKLGNGDYAPEGTYKFETRALRLMGNLDDDDDFDLRDGRRLEAAGQHALALLRQADAHVVHGPVAARVRVLVARPPRLAGGGAARPDDGVDAGRVDGLGPDGRLAANDLLGRLLGQPDQRVVRVDEAPVLGRVAPVVEGVGVLEGRAGLVVDPLAASAVEVEELVAAVDDLVAGVGELLDGAGAEPRLDDDVLADRRVPLEDHLLPDKGREAVLAEPAVGKVEELLQHRLQHRQVVGAQSRVEERVVGLVLVAAGVEGFTRGSRSSKSVSRNSSVKESLSLKEPQGGCEQYHSYGLALKATVLPG